MFENTYRELEHEGVDTENLEIGDLYAVFSGLKANRYSKEALPALLKEIASGTDPDAAVGKLGLEAVGADEAGRVIAAIVGEREDFVRSRGMAAVGPLMGPVMAALRGKIDGQQASAILQKEIARLLGRTISPGHPAFRRNTIRSLCS